MKIFILDVTKKLPLNSGSHMDDDDYVQWFNADLKT